MSNDIRIGIKVDRSEINMARKDLASLASDREKYGLGDVKIPVEVAESINKARGSNLDGPSEKAAKSASVFRMETEKTRKAVSDTVRDYNMLIREMKSFKSVTPDTRPFTPVSRSESDQMRRESAKEAAKFWTDIEEKPKRKTAADRYFEEYGNHGRTVTSRDDDGGTSGGGTGGRNSSHFMRRALGWGAAAVGVGSIAAYVAASRSAYRTAVDEESPLFAKGLTGSRGRASMAAGMGINPGEYYHLENMLSHTGINENAMGRNAMLTASFSKFAGLDTAEVAGLRETMYRSTGSGTISNAVIMAMSDSTRKGVEKARLPEMLGMISRNTNATAQAMNGAGVSPEQLGALTRMSTAALALNDNNSFKQFAKSENFQQGVMQHGLKSAGNPAGEIMLFQALGGFGGTMSFDKIHSMNTMRAGGFLENPELLQKIIGQTSGSKGERAGQLETLFPSWNINGKASEKLIEMAESGFLKKLTANKGKSIVQMAKGGDQEASRWLAEIKANPALGRQAQESKADIVKIEAGAQLSALLLPLESAATDMTRALASGDWKKSFSVLDKAAGEMSAVGKIFVTGAGLIAAGGAMNMIGGAMSMGKGGIGMLGALSGPGGILAGLGLGGAAAYGIFKDGAQGANYNPADRLNAITGKGPSTKFSIKWIPFKDEFDRAAQKHNIDPSLLYAMARTESGFKANAISKKGAVGPMQLMPGTAKELGVDPTIPGENIDGGTKYFSQLLKKYDGAQDKAVAAYNWGPGNVDKYGMSKLPVETERYVRDVRTAQQGYSTDSQKQAASQATTGSDSVLMVIADILRNIASNTETRHIGAQPLPIGAN